MQTSIDKRHVVDEPRRSEEIDLMREPDLYFALVAWEYYGESISDKSVEQWIEIGMQIERNGR